MKTCLSGSLLALALAFLAACGGGGGGGDNTGTGTGGGGGGGTPTATNHFPVYIRSSISPNRISALMAINPASPGTLLNADSGLDTSFVRPIVAGTLDSTTGVYRDVGTAAVLYNKPDGRLYAVNYRVSPPAARQVSSETSAATVCDNYTVTYGESDPDQSYVVYSLPGTDGNCATTADNVWRAVRLGMSSTDAPINAKIPLSLLRTGATPDGWLAFDGTTLRDYDINFSSGTAVTIGTFVSATEVGTAPNGNPVLRVGNALRLYDRATRTLSASYLNFTSVLSGWWQDGSDVFVVDGMARIYRFNSASPSAAVQLASDTMVTSMYTSANHVIYSVNNTAIKSVPKAGGSVTTVATASAGEQFTIVGTHGDRVHYMGFNSTTLPVVFRTGSALADGTGTPVNLPDTQVVAVVFPGDWPINSAWPALSRVVVAGKTAGSMAAQALASYDAATHGDAIALGTVPADIWQLLSYNFNSGPFVLASGRAASMSDIFVFRADVAGSLLRVTETPDTDERDVPF